MKLAVVAALAAAIPAFGQIKINDNISVTGWTVGSYQYSIVKPQVGSNISTDSLNVDAGLLSAIITPTKDVTATVSLYYRPFGGNSVPGGTNDAAGVSPNGSEVTLLDAYVAYDCGNGLTVSAGKFLSNLGYESFYQISDNMITLANQQILAPIPGYHEGVKLDYAADKTTTVGLELVDSEYSKPGYNGTEGTGGLKHSFGTEVYAQYTGVENLTLWAGAGYDSKGTFQPHDVYVFDLWASYQIDKTSTVAAEEIYKDGGDIATGGAPTDKGSNWLLYYQYNFTDKLSTWLCFSGEDTDGATVGTGKAAVSVKGPSYWMISVAPAYALTANLSVKFQYSFAKYDNFVAKNNNLLATEVAFKF
jgi:hypothetical protein